MLQLEWITLAFGIIAALLAAAATFFAYLQTRKIALEREKLFAERSEMREYLTPEREFMERRVRALLKEMYRSPGAFKEANRLILDSATAAEDIKVSKKSSLNEIIEKSKFLQNMGVTLESVSVAREQSDHDVFVVTPMSNEYLDEYKAIKDACENLDLKCIRGDEQYVSANLLKYIIESIIISDFVIVNISGRNPNVFYELAIAQMIGKQVIIVCGLATPIDFDISQQKMVLFGSRQELIEKLTAEIARMNIKTFRDPNSL